MVFDNRRGALAIGAATLVLVAFSLFAVRLLVDVRAARASVEHDVRWLIAVQHLDEVAGAGGDLAAPMETVRAFATSGAAPAAAETLATLSALEAAVGQRDLPATRGSCAALTKALRRQTAAVSATLGEAWSRLAVLVGGSLLLAVSALALVFAFARLSKRLLLRTEQERREAVHDAERLAESLQSLAGQVTHDLANPLSYVASNHRFLEAQLTQRLELGADIREALRDTSDGLRRMERLVSGLQAATMLSRSGERARVTDALNAVLLLVEPRVLKTSTLVRAFDRLEGCTVRPVPFMRLMSSVLIEAAELCGAGKSVVTIGGEGHSVCVSVSGPAPRVWAASLKAVAADLSFELALVDQPPAVTIVLT